MNIKNLKYDFEIHRQSFLACFIICFYLLMSQTGCSPKVAKIDLPYDSLQTFSLSGETAAPDKWWLVFQDEELNALMDTALNSNLDLETFWYQFREAGALVDISASEKWPEIFFQLQSGISIPEPDFVGGENTQLSLRANYEADLWGRIRYTLHAEEYRFKATYYDYKTAAISLSGEVALSWLRLKATQNLLQLIEEQRETNEKVLALIRARFASGQVRGVDILRQEQLIQNTREQIIGLELQMGTLKNQLSVLIGEPPGAIVDLSASLPELPPLPQTGFPLQLVNRRPDVLSAFYALQASDREVAAAISNKYPRLTFSANTAVRSNTFAGLLESQALSISTSLIAPLIYGGRLNAEVDRREAIKQQLLNNYGQTVLIAFREIEDALLEETKLQEQIEVIEEQVRLAESTFDQLQIEYLNGSIAYLDVLITLNQQQELRRELINAKLDLLETRTSLYRALAGGFETERDDEMEESIESQ